MEVNEVTAELQARANPANVAGMARYGISSVGTLGVNVPFLRALAKRIGKDPTLATQLWASGIHEARILAPMVADPATFTRRQASQWVRDVDSWDICDGLSHSLLRYTPFAFEQAAQWATARPEYVRRAAFALMAGLAVSDKKATDAPFEAFLPLIAAAACDDRNMVRKAVNWALRQIGKRNRKLHAKAIRAAEQIARQDSRSARWIASDALRELRGPIVARKLHLTE